MKPLLLTLFALIFFSTASIAQDLINILSNQICECLEKENITNMEDGNACFEQVLVKNLDKLYEYYNVKTLEEINFDKMGADIGAILTKECDYMVRYFTNPINKFEEEFIPEKNLDCSALRSGEYYYVSPNITTKVNDTTYVSIKDNMYLERFNDGRKYALLDINWSSDCKFDLIFKDSNDINKNAFSKKGDIYSYEMVSSTPRSYIIRMTYKEQDYKFELFTID